MNTFVNGRSSGSKPEKNRFFSRQARYSVLAISLMAASFLSLDGPMGSAGARQPAKPATGPVITSVSGNFQHGGSATLTGIDLGTKPAAAPLKYDDFEQGTAGMPLQNWFLEPGHTSPQYSDTLPRPNSHLSAQAIFTNGEWLSSFGIAGTPIPHIYIDFWYRYDAQFPYSRNHKLFRIHSANYSPNLYYNVYCQGQGDVSHLSQDGVTASPTAFGQWIGGWSSANFAGVWRHVQAYFEESSPNASDGTAEMWIDGQMVVHRVHDWETRNDNSDWNKVLFGNYLAHDPYPAATPVPDCGAYGDASTSWDNVYVDNTLAHLELCDAASKAAASECEIEVPSAWSDTSVTFQVNRGGFSDVRGKYLYLTTAQGDESPGFQIPTGPAATATPSPTVTATPITPAATATPCPIQFTDVPPTHPFYSYIRCLVCEGIVGGYADNTFRPGNDVTRGQMAKFVSNAAGYNDSIPPTQQTFIDVPPSHPFWLFIERAHAHGVISGYSDHTFHPNAVVTRDQAAKFVANAANYTDAIPPTQQTFVDVPPSHPFWLFIERVHAHGVVGGYSDQTFRPGNNVTRGQTSKFIANAFFPGCAPPR